MTDDCAQVDYGALLTRKAKPGVRGMSQEALDRVNAYIEGKHMEPEMQAMLAKKGASESKRWNSWRFMKLCMQIQQAH